jgi:hypothetical protein
MTSEQKDLFIKVAQMGVACGLAHPYEWYTNALSHYAPTLAYAEQADFEGRLDDTFVAFMRGAASLPEEEDLTVRQFIQDVAAWYNLKHLEEERRRRLDSDTTRAP